MSQDSQTLNNRIRAEEAQSLAKYYRDEALTAATTATGVAAKVENVASLKTFSFVSGQTPANNFPIQLLGYNEAGDGGGGLFYVDTNDTTTPEDGGTVFVTNGGLRIKRAGVDGNVVKLAWWGINKNISDSKSKIQEAFAYIKEKESRKVIFPTGKIMSSSNLVMECADRTIIEGNGCELSMAGDFESTNIDFLEIKSKNENVVSASIVGNNEPGQKSLEVDDATGIYIGMIAHIKPEISSSYVGDGIGEINKVLMIQGNNIFFDTLTKENYDSLDTINFTWGFSSLSVRNLKIDTQGKNGRGLYLHDALDVIIDNVSIYDDIFTRFEDHAELSSFTNGFRIERCYNVYVSNFYSSKHRYGLFVTDSSFVKIADSYGENGWHTFELTGSSWFIEYINCYTINDSYGFRSHNCGQSTYTNCYTIGGRGFYLQGYSCKMKNIEIIDADPASFILNSTQGGPALRTEFVKNLDINDLKINAISPSPNGLIWRNVTTSVFGEYLHDCEINLKNVHVKGGENLGVQIINFKNIKTSNFTMEWEEPHGSTYLDGFVITAGNNNPQSQKHADMEIINPYRRCLQLNAGLSVESAKIEIDGIKLSGNYLDGGSATSAWLIGSSIDNLDIYITGTKFDVVGASELEFNNFAELRCGNLYVSNNEVFSGITTQFLLVRGTTQLYASNNTSYQSGLSLFTVLDSAVAVVDNNNFETP